MNQLIGALHATVAKWRAGNQDHRDGVVLVWQGEVYGKTAYGMRFMNVLEPTP